MKKNILISTAFVGISLITFGFIKWNGNCSSSDNTTCNKANEEQEVFLSINEMAERVSEADFHYDIASRFNATITLEDLRKARTISDLVPRGATDNMSSFTDVNINILTEDGNLLEKGKDDQLNKQQIKLLQKATYSTNFNVEAFCKHINDETGKLEKYCFVYYVTVIPEKEANYNKGEVALINYLKNGSKKEVSMITQEELKPGKISFVVNKNGIIEQVKLVSTSGFNNIDSKMIKLVKSIPGKWTPAENSAGEKVDQQLFYSFGLIGC